MTAVLAWLFVQSYKEKCSIMILVASRSLVACSISKILSEWRKMTFNKILCFSNKFNIFCLFVLLVFICNKSGAFCLSERLNLTSLTSSSAAAIHYLNGKHFRFASVQVYSVRINKKQTLIDWCPFKPILVPAVRNGTAIDWCEWLTSFEVWRFLLRNSQNIKIHL